MSAHGSVLRFRLLDAAVLQALIAGRIKAATTLAGVPLPPEFLEDIWLWQLRFDQIQQEPDSAPWLTRATIRISDGLVIGHAGFHGPPDERGMVEIGYQVLPSFRLRGYGLATARLLIAEAVSKPTVTVVRASISPDNTPSLAIARGLGFEHVGEQIDDIDGLELIFELAIEEVQ